MKKKQPKPKAKALNDAKEWFKKGMGQSARGNYPPRQN